MAEERDKAKKQKELFLKQLVKTPVVAGVCQQLKIPKSNVYRWEKEDPEFKKGMEEARKEKANDMVELAEFQLYKKIQEGNISAIKYILDSRHPVYMRQKFKHDQANEIQPMQMMISVVDNKGRPVNKKKLTKKINKTKTKTVKLKKMNST